jgi:hypothetical protein
MRGADLIIDGYNLIFRLAPEALDAAERLRDYRRRLETAVRDFGAAGGRQPWIVYDGRRLPGPASGARQEQHLRVSFAEPPAEADDVICQMALQARAAGQRVTVVTSDAGLASRVRPAAVAVMAVEDFGAALLPAAAPPEHVIGAPDVEQYFLRLHAREEAVQALVERQEQVPATQVTGSSPPPGPAGGDADARDQRQRRRQKGRRRQARRLADPDRSRGKKRRRRH